jgi:4a-hydroxytetrahydrobiopterin dehydratase
MSKTYSETEIATWLEANLPTWRFADGHLTRTYRTGSWQLTLLLAGAIGYLAEAGWHHPELILTYPRLTVRLQTHDAGGVTDKDFELARRWLTPPSHPGTASRTARGRSPLERAIPHGAPRRRCGHPAPRR